MDKLLDKKEILKILNISKGKLDNMIKNNEIDYIRMGKVIRFDKENVFKSINNGNRFK